MSANIQLKDFYKEIESNPDLRRLGEYKVVIGPEDTSNLEIKINSPLTDVYLGGGDFTDLSVNFTHTLIRNLHLGSCNFSELNLSESNISVFNLAQARIEKMIFGKSEVFIALFGDSKIEELRLGAGKLNDLVGQEGEVDDCTFEGRNIKRVAPDWMVAKSVKYEFQESQEAGKFFADFTKTKGEADQLRLAYEVESKGIIETIDTASSDSNQTELASSATVRTITLKEFYAEIEENSDLRRLGSYKVSLPEGEIIFPIDVKFLDRDIHLGHGDFKEVFVAFCETVARSVDLGDSEFSDLYLDRLDTTLFDFGGARGSRVYFDIAKIHTTRFGEFNVGEVFLDIAQLNSIKGENSKSSLFFREGSRIKDFDEGNMVARGEHYNEDRVEGKIYNKNTEEEKSSEKVYTIEELEHEVSIDPDLRRLGSYKVIKGPHDSQLDLNLETKELTLGNGDFSLLGELQLNIKCKRINFGESIFGVLNIGFSESETIDMEASGVKEIHFNKSKIGNVYFGDSTADSVKFDESILGEIYGERGSVKRIELGSLTAKSIHLCNLKSDEIRFGDSTIQEILLSRGDGVHSMFFENSEVHLVNFHEGRLAEVDFGNSTIGKTSILRASIDELRCRELKTEALIFSQEHFKNRIGVADFGDMKGIGGIYMDVFLDGRAVDEAIIDEKNREHLQNFGKLSFGKLI